LQGTKKYATICKCTVLCLTVAWQGDSPPLAQ